MYAHLSLSLILIHFLFFKIADSDVYTHLTFAGIYFLSGQPYLNIYACKG
jgi:hypothetical protein